MLKMIRLLTLVITGVIIFFGFDSSNARSLSENKVYDYYEMEEILWELDDASPGNLFLDIPIGNRATLLKTLTSERYGIACRSFIIKVTRTGNYYLSAFYSAPENQMIDVYIDGRHRPEFRLIPKQNGWQFGLVQQQNRLQTIYLSKGTHCITFSQETNHVPLVSDIKLGRTKAAVSINMNYFLDWYEDLKHTDNRKFNQYQANREAVSYFDLTPLKEYHGHVDQELTYTYNREFLLEQGRVWFEITGIRPNDLDPVIYLYSKEKPNQYSWSGKEFAGGSNSRDYTFIDVYIEDPGSYILLVTSQNYASNGLVDVYHKGRPVDYDAPVAGLNYNYEVNWKQDSTLHFFTCNPYINNTEELDTVIWIGQEDCGPIRGFNDNATGGNSRFAFDWGKMSVIKSSRKDIRHAIVAAKSPPRGNRALSFDVYLGAGVPQPKAYPGASEYDVFDRIKSSGPTAYQPHDYNCYAYSGGVSNRRITPYSNNQNPWWDDTQKKRVRNYYANKNQYGGKEERHAGAADYVLITGKPGAPDYEREVEEKAVIAVLRINDELTGSFKHAQVRRDANNHLHGYAWESKAGALDRFFHPKTALYNVYKTKEKYTMYFKHQPKPPGEMEMSFEEAVAKGLEIIPPEERLTRFEKRRLNKLIYKVPRSKRYKIYSLTRKLDYKIKSNSKLLIESNIEPYRKTTEYKNLINYCKKLGDKSLPLLFYKILKNKHFIYLTVINDLAGDKYEDIFQDLMDDYRANKYTKDGAHIQFSARNIMIKFARIMVKEVL